MSRPTSDSPVVALRSALQSNWPTLRRAAEVVIRRALKLPTWGLAAERLGLSRRSLERLRVDFPSVFEGHNKSTDE